MRFNSRGTKTAEAAELPTAHISHLQQGSGSRFSRRRAQALGSRRIHLSAVRSRICPLPRTCLPKAGDTQHCAPIEALSGREVMRGHTSKILFFFIYTQSEGRKKTFVSVWTCFQQFCAYTNQKRFPPRLCWKWEKMAEREGP